MVEGQSMYTESCIHTAHVGRFSDLFMLCMIIIVAKLHLSHQKKMAELMSDMISDMML